MRSTLVRFFIALLLFHPKLPTGLYQWYILSAAKIFLCVPQKYFNCALHKLHFVCTHKSILMMLQPKYILSVPMKVLGAQFSLQVFRINMKNSQINSIRPFQIHSLFLFGGKVGNILWVRTTLASSQGKCAACTDSTFTWTPS